MIEDIHCTNCLRPYPDQGTPYHCLSCGGLFDYSEISKFEPARIDTAKPGIWRYFHTFGFPDNIPQVTLGEGNTPLIWTKLIGKKGKYANVGFKCEYINPTGSFKDRGSALITSFLLSRGIDQALEDFLETQALHLQLMLLAEVSGQKFSSLILPQAQNANKSKPLVLS